MKAINKANNRIIMKPKEKIVETSDMLSHLQNIYATQISKFQKRCNTSEGLSSQDITDLSKLVQSLAIINKEIRESRDQGILQSLPLEEQLKLLQEALDTLGVTSDGKKDT